jgi:hypothetical protein
MNAEEVANDIDTIRNDTHTVVTGIRYLIEKLQRGDIPSLTAMRLHNLALKLESVEERLDDEYTFWIDEADK